MRPTPLAAAVFAASIVLAAAAAFAGATGPPLWLGVLAIFASVFALDAWRLPRRAEITARLSAPDELVVGEPQDARLTIEAPGPDLPAVVLLEAAGDLEAPPASSGVLSSGRLTVAFPLVSERRGVARRERAWVRLDGPLGLARRVVTLPLASEMRVIPRVAASGRAVSRFDAPDARVGTKIERYDGDGSEFDTLREFRVGDDSRAIDWKSTARHRMLLRRQFRAERDHDLVLAVDTGRLMAERIAGTPKLDHALRACLRLAQVALASGDRVGLFGFDERPRVSLPPDRGVRAHQALRLAAARLEPHELETNYTLSLSTLLGSLRRRTLVVVVSDFADTVSAELLVDNLRRLSRRHVVVFVALHDDALDALDQALPVDRPSLHRAVIAGTLKRERRLVLERLRRLGIWVVVAPADKLGTDMIDRYLDLKRREVA